MHASITLPGLKAFLLQTTPFCGFCRSVSCALDSQGVDRAAILGKGSERSRARPHFIFIRQLLSAGLIILGAGSKSRNGLYPHWLPNIKFALLTTILVPEAGLEPARFAAEPFEGCVSTNSTIRANWQRGRGSNP